MNYVGLNSPWRQIRQREVTDCACCRGSVISGPQSWHLHVCRLHSQESGLLLGLEPVTFLSLIRVKNEANWQSGLCWFVAHCWQRGPSDTICSCWHQIGEAVKWVCGCKWQRRPSVETLDCTCLPPKCLTGNEAGHEGTGAREHGDILCNERGV